MKRDFWTVILFGEHQVAVGHAEEIGEARWQVETAQAGYMTAWRELWGGDGGNL